MCVRCKRFCKKHRNRVRWLILHQTIGSNQSAYIVLLWAEEVMMCVWKYFANAESRCGEMLDERYRWKKKASFPTQRCRWLQPYYFISIIQHTPRMELSSTCVSSSIRLKFSLNIFPSISTHIDSAKANANIRMLYLISKNAFILRNVCSAFCLSFHSTFPFFEAEKRTKYDRMQDFY